MAILNCINTIVLSRVVTPCWLVSSPHVWSVCVGGWGGERTDLSYILLGSAPVTGTASWCGKGGMITGHCIYREGHLVCFGELSLIFIVFTGMAIWYGGTKVITGQDFF